MSAPDPSSAAPPREIGGAQLLPVAFSALTGWRSDDHRAALAAFRTSCRALLDGRAMLRPGLSAPADLLEVCRAASSLAADPPNRDARHFFESHFTPYRVVPPSAAGFLTGYFEPEYAGAVKPEGAFTTPLLARPDDLVTLAPGETRPGLDPTLTAARRTAKGFEPYPDRAAIEDGALGAKAVPLVYLDWIEAFLAQVQGSVRVKLTDGRVLRLAYAGRNGLPYTSLGKLVAAESGLPPKSMTMPRLVAWLRDHPAEGRRLMRRNRSYVFFRRADELAREGGPLGAASVQLVPGRSIAVDRNLWPYGLPFWIEAAIPEPDGRTTELRRLTVAHDTGTAIVGPARADLFFGTGKEAGARAGLVQHSAQFHVLLPRAAAPLAGTVPITTDGRP